MNNVKTISELEIKIKEMQKFLKYLKSKRRNNSILNKENINQVHHCDVENFKAL